MDAKFAEAIAEKAKAVTVLDHHLTAITDFTVGKSCEGTSAPENLHLEFDVHRSGASISLDYFSRRFHSEKYSSPQIVSASSSSPAVSNTVTDVQMQIAAADTS